MKSLTVAGLLTGLALTMYSFGIYLQKMPPPRGQQKHKEITKVEAYVVDKGPILRNGLDTTSSKPSFSATSIYSVHIDSSGKETVLYQENSTDELPIASISKLMTALVAKRSIKSSTVITISEEALNQYTTAGKLALGQKFLRDELLYPLLIESSNDAAHAYAEVLGFNHFIDEMNETAELLNMKNTTFTNPSGIDQYGGNISTAKDLVKLVRHIKVRHSDILDITARKAFHAINQDETYSAILTTTNTTLNDPGIPFTVTGGKTGETPNAQQTLLLVTDAPQNNGYMVHIILNSKNRHIDMVTLINWIYNAYTWN